MEKLLRGVIVLETPFESDPPAPQTGEMGIPPRVPVAIGSIGAGEGNGGDIPPAFLNASYDHIPDKKPVISETAVFSRPSRREALAKRIHEIRLYIGVLLPQ